MTIEPIGVIHSPFKTKEDCPVQPKFSSLAAGRIEVFPDYAAGLKDIDGFSHIYVLYQFDRASEIKLVRPTFLDDEPHGIYASRHPCRPNSIGMSIVKLVKKDGDVLHVEGVDMLDGTPVVDIKPYIARFDSIPDASEGWISDKQWRPKPPGRE